jgi:hypothetical protein
LEGLSEKLYKLIYRLLNSNEIFTRFIKKFEFLQNVLQRYTIIPKFLENLNRLEVCVFARAVKLESPCTIIYND